MKSILNALCVVIKPREHLSVIVIDAEDIYVIAVYIATLGYVRIV